MITIVYTKEQAFFQLQVKESHPFLRCSACSLSLWLAPLILQGEEVPVVINQKILGKISRTVSVFLKTKSSQNWTKFFLNKQGFINTLMPTVSPSLRWNGAPSSDSAFRFFFFLETCWL